jgi:threonine-phosphate decarboxylase
LADRSGIWIILDETFIEYCEERSVLPWLVRHPRLLILRSFTKFYSLPGLRIGYSVSSPLAATLLRRYQPPWSVNVMAQHAAEAAIRDRDHARRCLAYLRQERERFASRLSSIPGLVVFPSRANFLLLELPEPYDARAVTVELRRRGLLIRDCSSVPGLSPRSIRVAVLGKGDNDRFLAALKKALR